MLIIIIKLLPRKDSDLDFCQISFLWKLKNQKNYFSERSNENSLTKFNSN